MSFLNAEWKNLALINYDVDAKILEKYLPAGTEIDFWNNKCYVSLVGFMFKNTRVLGLKVPFYTDFEEVNLRFYVKRFENGEWKRGVVFIKEIVSKKAITFIANTLYQENYETHKMSHEILKNENTQTFIYKWRKNKKWNTIQLETQNETDDIKLHSEAEFITEHYFGYTKCDENKTFEYEVKHPRWEQFEVINHKIEVDFKDNYGQDFAFLENAKPISVFLAKGSKIKVENKKTIQYESAFKIVEITNICALLFLLAGGYGIALTGILQVLAALLFLILFPKDKWIYLYFGMVIGFFLIWDGEILNWLFLLPITLIFFLTFIIYNQKKKL